MELAVRLELGITLSISDYGAKNNMQHGRIFLVIFFCMCLLGCFGTKGKHRIDFELRFGEPISFDKAIDEMSKVTLRFDRCRIWGTPELRRARNFGFWECKPNPNKNGTGYQFRLKHLEVDGGGFDTTAIKVAFFNDNTQTFKIDEWEIYSKLLVEYLPEAFPTATKIEPLTRLADVTAVTDLVELSDSQSIELTDFDLERIRCYNANLGLLFWKKIQLPGLSGECKDRRRFD